MAINFPSTPTTGQTFSVGNTSYTWNGSSWETSVENSYQEVWKTLEPESVYENYTLGHWMRPWPDLSTSKDNTGTGSILHGYRVNPGDELRVDTTILSNIGHVFYFNENDTTNGNLGDWSTAMTSPWDLANLGTQGWESFTVYDRDIKIPSSDVTHVFVLGRVTPPVLKRKTLTGTLREAIIADSKSVSSRELYGKNILWLGTSIPRGGGWAESACSNLGATCINRAIASSTIRDRGWDGTLATVWQNYTYSLQQTIAEKEAIVAEQNSGVTDGPLLSHITLNRPVGTLSAAEEGRVIASSYENSIIPFIDGTDPRQVDVIVFEHSHNDLWLDITTPWNNFTTVNSSTVLDTNTFPGAFKFIIDEIRKVNPQVQILLVTEYCADDINTKAMVDGVINVGEYFGLPVCDLSNIAGISNQVTVPNTADLWNTWPWSNYSNPGRDMNMREYRIPDKIHPHTDATMITQRIITAHLTDFLRRTVVK